MAGFAGTIWGLEECASPVQSLGERGVWEAHFKDLAEDADNEYAIMDSTVVRAYQQSAGAQKNGGDEAMGRSQGGLSTKIHATIDALGNPVPPDARSSV